MIKIHLSQQNSDKYWDDGELKMQFSKDDSSMNFTRYTMNINSIKTGSE